MHALKTGIVLVLNMMIGVTALCFLYPDTGSTVTARGAMAWITGYAGMAIVLGFINVIEWINEAE